MPQGAARDVAKVLNSAAANAENNHDLSRDDLVVVEATADEGPTIKRIRPRAQGRAFAIHKPMTHVTVVVERQGGLSMGRKVHPYGFRLGSSRTWNAKWYADQGLHRPAQGGHHHPPAGRQAAGQRQRQRWSRSSAASTT